MNNKNSLKKRIVWVLITALIAAVSIWAVVSQSKGFTFEGFIEFIAEADDRYVALAVLSMLGFIVFEALSLHVILKSFGFRRNFVKNFVYSASDIYFSAITPSASGGQPASAYFMMSDGIPVGTTTAALILNLMFYAAAILVIGAAAVIVRPQVWLHFDPLSKGLIIFGVAAQMVLVTVFFLLLKKEQLLRSIFRRLVKLGSRLHFIGAFEKYEARLENVIDQYKQCAELVENRRGLLVRVFLFNLLQRASIIMVPVFIFLAVGGEVRRAADIWAVQCFVVLGSNCIPVPGAIGVSDFLMLDGVETLVITPVSLELFSRGLSFYICVLLCGIVTLLAYLVKKEGKRIDKAHKKEKKEG